MTFRIDYESSFSHDLTGRRMPKQERRVTLESAEKRARYWLARMSGNGQEPTRNILGGASGYLYLDCGPTLGASISKVD